MKTLAEMRAMADMDAPDSPFGLELCAYAAKAAVDVLIQNWTDTNGDGLPEDAGGSLLVDLDDVITELQKFKAAAS